MTQRPPGLPLKIPPLPLDPSETTVSSLVTTVPRRPPGRPLKIPILPLDTNESTAGSINPHVLAVTRMPPDTPFIIPSVPLETSDCAGRTAVCPDAHKPLGEPRWEDGQQPSKIGRAKRLRNIEVALAKPTQVTKAESGPPAKRVRKFLDNAGTETAQAPATLSPEQAHILTVVEEGNSVFFTGSAGTGKSLLLREIIRTLTNKHPPSPNGVSAIAITASTGLAALQIGGITLNAFAGIGLGQQPADKCIKGMPEDAKRRWIATKVLLVDEISMVDARIFELISNIARTLRGGPLHFGGIQLVVTGDFFQLPPATSSYKYAFEAACWNEAIPFTFNLTKVFRQRNQEFIELLNAARYGMLTLKNIEILKERCSHPVEYEDGVEPMELYPLRAPVDAANETRLLKLKTHVREFVAIDDGPRFHLDAVRVEGIVKLCVGAQVMLLRNKTPQLVNGAIGVVLDFVQSDPATNEHAIVDELVPIVQFTLPDGNRTTYTVHREKFIVEQYGQTSSRIQLPLALAWALSMHKAQGQSLDRVKVDLDRVFHPGQAYVALSRATSLDGLQVVNFTEDKIRADPKVVKWTKSLQIL